MEAYSGCVTKVDAELHKNNPGICALIGIEIIEHLHPDILRGFEETVFGVYSPNIVILTTPNSEFNSVFNLSPGKFRHWDHKFEWSRMEFDSWCSKIVQEFPFYTYQIKGICEGPPETKHLGCVSQMAIFVKSNFQNQIPSQLLPYASRIQNNAYNLISKVVFPNYKETRSPEEIVLTEFQYYVVTFLFSRSRLLEYEELDMKEVLVPISKIQSLTDVPEIARTNPEFIM